MIRNYIKLTVRNLRKHFANTIINAVGLTVAFLSLIIIGLYANYELTYNQFHKNIDETYLVYKQRITPTGTQDSYDTWVPLAQELKRSYAAVKYAAPHEVQNAWVSAGEQKFQEEITLTNADFFQVFSFPLSKGNSDNPFPVKNSAIISQGISEKYFGDTDPVGKTIRVNFEAEYIVTGVLGKFPSNSSIEPDIVLPFESVPWYSQVEANWNSSFISTFITLSHDSDTSELVSQLQLFVERIWDAETAERTNFRLLPLDQLQNTFTDNHRIVFILLTIGVGILIIAALNFINISTAQSIERANEIGMRKTLGATRFQLIRGYLGETAALSLIAVIIALFAAEIMLPVFNNIFTLNIQFSIKSDLSITALFISIALMIGLTSGLYPAFRLTQFRSLDTLKGKSFSLGKGQRITKGLVIFQFTVSVILIVGILVFQKQIRFMQNADYGFDKEQIISIPVELSDFQNQQSAAGRLAVFRNSLQDRSDIAAVTTSQTIPGQWSHSFTFAVPAGWEGENPLRVRYAFVDENFFGTFGIDLIQGREFIENSQSDIQQNAIINAAALKAFGWDSIQDKYIRPGRDADEQLHVIGVVKDYHYMSLADAVAPVIHLYRPPSNQVHNYISVKMNTADMGNTLAAIGNLWQQVDPTRNFNYFFVDEQVKSLYETEERLKALSMIFTVIAIIIAAIGLMGLVSLSVRQRSKELSVRKIVGATMQDITMLLSWQYLKLILTGFVLALPVSFILMQNWLSRFATKITLSPGIYLLAAGIILFTALVAMSYHLLKASFVNPVETLRYE